MMRSIAFAFVLAAACLGSSALAVARPNPCLELAAIVGSYTNTSSHGGKTAAQLFADQGKLTVFVRLGQAAAHVQNHETAGPGINVISANADQAYAELSARIRWLGAADLNAYSGVSLSPENTADPFFCTRGILGGIYARGNSAALVGRVADALFLSFRATNDGWNLTDAPVTPDALDWTEQSRHYQRFQYLLAALSGYVAAHPGITQVYVAGDSLGAAMAQMYMLNHPHDARLQAIVFGSPGNPTIARQDWRIWTFINDIDPILLVPALRYVISGKRFLVRLGITPSVPPLTIYHNPQAYVRVMQHLDRNGVGRDYLAAKFAGGTYDRWNAIFLRLQVTDWFPADFFVGVPGTITSLPGSTPRLMLGGDGPDRIVGGYGEGDLVGRGGRDCLMPMNGPERVFGGPDGDWFVLRGNYAAFGAQVMDFASGSDKIVALATLPAFTNIVDGRNYIRGTSATRFGPTLIYDRASGDMWFDADGISFAPKYLIGKFPAKPAIWASDISLTLPGAC